MYVNNKMRPDTVNFPFTVFDINTAHLLYFRESFMEFEHLARYGQSHWF